MSDPHAVQLFLPETCCWMSAFMIITGYFSGRSSNLQIRLHSGQTDIVLHYNYDIYI